MLGNKYAVHAKCYLAHNISLRVWEVLQRNLSIHGIEAQVFDGSHEHGCPGFHRPVTWAVSLRKSVTCSTIAALSEAYPSFINTSCLPQTPLLNKSPSQGKGNSAWGLVASCKWSRTSKTRFKMETNPMRLPRKCWCYLVPSDSYAHWQWPVLSLMPSMTKVGLTPHSHLISPSIQDSASTQPSLVPVHHWQLLAWVPMASRIEGTITPATSYLPLH